MQQKRVNNKLYVLDFTPYEITEDTDVEIIYVQQEKYNEYVELNPSLADKIKTINYLIYTVKKKEWADDEPSPSEKKETGLNFTVSYYTLNQGGTGNFADFIDNPNGLDYTIGLDQNGNMLDQSDNEYITWDDELNYTVHNNFTGGLTISLNREEDTEWYGVSESRPSIILPNENEQSAQEEAISSTFDEQSDALDIYLTPEILADMIAASKTSDIIANILNYRYVMTAECVDAGNWVSGNLYVHYNNDGYIHIGIDDRGTFYRIFTITKNGLGGMNSDSIEFNPNTEWVILHKPSNASFCAIYLDGQSNTRYIKTDALYEDANDNDLNYNQSFVNINGQTFKISDNGSYSTSFKSSKSGAATPYGDGYYVNPDNFPTNPFGIQSVEMVPADTNSTLTVTYPEGEQWYVELENFVWLHVDALNDYVISAGHEVTVFLDGSYDQPTANHVYAVSGINQSDINGNSFTMPNNNVTVNAEFKQAGTPVDLKAMRPDPDGETGDAEKEADYLVSTLASGAQNQPLEDADGLPIVDYFGYHEVDGEMVKESFALGDVVWTCDIPAITFNYVEGDWTISCDSSYTPNGSETATVTLKEGLEFTGSKQYPITPQGS